MRAAVWLLCRRLGYGGNTDQPAASERLADSTRGVSRQGFLVVLGFMAGGLTAGALGVTLVRGAYTKASAAILKDGRVERRR
jgi:hypothetical protein